VVLIKIVGKIFPNGEYGWRVVAIAYQDATKEETTRNVTDLKKHWIKNQCNMKKPTGQTGENNDHVHRCMAIEKKIMKKTHSGILGLSSNIDTIPSENEDSGGVNQWGGGGVICFLRTRRSLTMTATQLQFLLMLTTRLVLSPRLLLSIVLLTPPN
jgi:hypothetical protein